jgi:hypothetical protein
MPTSKILEIASGNGHLQRSASEATAVKYRLVVGQRMVEALPNAPAIPGMITITGRIESSNDPTQLANLYAGGPRERYTLHLEDGRKLDLYLGNGSGSISPDGSFY